MDASSPLLPVLHRTLRTLSEPARLTPEDQALAEFRRTLVRMIAELEMRQDVETESEAA